MGRWLLILAATLWIAALCVAQLPIVQLTQFTSPAFGGGGTVGVVKDSTTGNITVLDFDQFASIHVFSAGGVPIFSWTAAYCSPTLPSPNGLTQDRTTGSAWLVDNHNGMPVAEMSGAGNCVGSWPLAGVNNPMSIAHHGVSGDLFVGSYAAITRWSRSGVQTGGAIPVSFPNSGSWIVSGLAWIAPTDRLILAQNGGSDLYEIDLTGAPLSITSLLPWGITNIQGLDYDPTTGHLVVIDNATATVHVFDYLPPAPAMWLNVWSLPGGAASMTIGNLPATTTEGWTLVSGNVGGPVGLGPVAGLYPDVATGFLVLGFPTAAPGHPFHWTSPSPTGGWPQSTFTFAPGSFSSLSGQTLDVMTIALDAQGVGIQASNVVRLTF